MLLSELFEARKPWLRITPEHIRQAKGGKAQIIVEMDATTFLMMTTNENPESIRKTSQRLKNYNRYAKSGENILMPFLVIALSNDGASGRVVGHEGRHRAAALEREGTGIIPVALILKPGKDMLPDIHFGAEYHLTSKDLPRYLIGQYNKRHYDTQEWKIIQSDMQAGVRRSGQ